MNTALRALWTGAFLILSAAAWAHVTVSPRQAAPASWLTFTVSVPNEKDTDNTEVTLALPSGIGHVTPTVKPGWTIVVERNSEGHPSAIVWKGRIPAGFRDDFTFSTQVPAAGELAWKAYQTYRDGSVVAWEVDPSGPEAHDSEALEKTGKGPYSVTKITESEVTPQTGFELPLSTVALVLSAVSALMAALALRRRS